MADDKKTNRIGYICDFGSKINSAFSLHRETLEK
jgi:hypothetical protein